MLDILARARKTLLAAALPLLAATTMGQPAVQPQAARIHSAQPAMSAEQREALNASELQRVARAYLASLPEERSEAERGARLDTLARWAGVVARQQPGLRSRSEAEHRRLSVIKLPPLIAERERKVASELMQRSARMEQAAQQIAQAAAQKRHEAASVAARDLLQLLGTDGVPSAAAGPRLNWQSKAPARFTPWLAHPRTSPAGLSERVFGARRVAALGGLSGLELPDADDTEAPQPADLASSGLTQADAEIRAKVQELGNSPVRIHNWVRNSVRFVPGWGVTQTAAATFAQRQGNAYDIATLLVTMLRQANVPARYVYGTVEMPAAVAQRWLGTDLVSAAQLLSKARVPSRVVTQSGGPQALQLEHVWVEAFVSGAPSRGSVIRAGDSWWMARSA